MYKISIIIPVFDVNDTLENAFNSIFNQTIDFKDLEIIFVDDCSTDGSSDILKKLDDTYDNVKSIFLEKNSGFAGKPRNVGIENATADYLMFLDPDDIFVENACEILYNAIINSNSDVVSGNYDINRDNKIVRNKWNLLNLKEGEFLQVNNITENSKLLMTVPSVWAKIFKKEFILKNKIKFPVGVPGQDLVFVSHSLLKANGIKFINEPIIQYIPRETGESKSITSRREKKVLSGFIRAYTELYWIFDKNNKEYCWLAPRNLFFWMKQLILSELPISDKVDLLYSANFLFEKFIESDKLNPPKGLNNFLNLIEKKDFFNAAVLSNHLSIYYKNNDELRNIVMNKPIFSLFYGMDLNIGGLAKAVFNRSNVLKEFGFNINLLNIDELKNFEYVISHFKEIGFLNESINFINIFDYYSEKNTGDKLVDKSDFLMNIPYGTSFFEEYIIKKSITPDQTIVLDYYDKNSLNFDEININEINDLPQDKLLKTELYMGNFLRINRTYSNNKVSCEKFYTKDEYNYITIKYKGYDKFVTLYDRKMKLNLSFNSLFEFYDYFYNDFLIQFKDNKPFLINECSGPVPDFNNIDRKLAYKIANIHTNPYEGKHCYGSPLRNVAALKDTSNLDLLVVLTEGLKKDFIKEFNTNNIGVVPNFPDNFEKPSNKNIEKNYNKISIFARLSSEKNLSDAIKAFRTVVDKRENSYLNIYGRALKPYEINEEKRLRELVKELNLENHVLFNGHVDNVDEEMTNSLATMLVSDIEGMPMVLLESMRNGTPLICYNFNYGPSDFIIDGVTGRLVKQYDVEGLANAILDVLNKPEKAVEMGKNAQNKILADLNKEKLCLRWEKIFKDVYVNSFVPENMLKINNERESTIIQNTDEKIKELNTKIVELSNVNQKLNILNQRLNEDNQHYKNNLKLLKKQKVNDKPKKFNIKKIFKKINKT